MAHFHPQSDHMHRASLPTLLSRPRWVHLFVFSLLPRFLASSTPTGAGRQNLRSLGGRLRPSGFCEFAQGDSEP